MDITVYDLAMTHPEELCAASAADQELVVPLAPRSDGQLNRDFYHRVGAPWHWTDRLFWSNEAWNEYADRETLHTLTANHRNNTIGYAELEHLNQEVHIMLFGLLPQAIGHGHGGPFLTEVLRYAWSLGPERVTVETCTLDHPAALRNYLARGMKIIGTRQKAHP